MIEEPADEACTICEALLTDVAKFIPATYTEADLKALLDKGYVVYLESEGRFLRHPQLR